MKRKLYYLLKSLNTKIIALIIITIIPLNILLIFTTEYMGTLLEQRLIDASSSNLKLFTSQIDYSFLASTKYLASFFDTPDLILMNNANSNDDRALAKQRVWNDLSQAISRYQYIDILFIYSNQSDTLLLSKSNSFDIKNDQFKEIIVNSKKQSTPSTIIEINNKNYIYSYIKYRDYIVGSFTNINNLLEGAKMISTYSESHFYITQNNAILPQLETKKVSQNKTTNSIFSFFQPTGYKTISQPFAKNELQFIEYIPRKEILSGLPSIYKIVLGSSVFTLFFFPLLLIILRLILLKPLKQIEQGIYIINQGNLQYRLPATNTSYEIQLINSTFNKMMDQITSLKIQSYEDEIEKQTVQFQNLQLQINPHFLLNSLNIIYNLAQIKDYDVIQELTLCLVRYFRYSYNSTLDLVPIYQEIKFIKDYLSIQNLRFKNRFVTLFNIDDTANDYKIPPLLIQNFVENCFKYALKPDTITVIEVSATLEENKLMIMIRDNGKGIPKPIIEKIKNGHKIYRNNVEHIGIWNCKKRLSYIYGNKATLTITSKESFGTNVKITIDL